MNLKELKKKTEEIIEKLQRKKKLFCNDAINWADLHCVRTEKAIDQDGREVFRVYIEEASPTASKFKDAIWKELISFGFDIEIITEW